MNRQASTAVGDGVRIIGKDVLNDTVATEDMIEL